MAPAISKLLTASFPPFGCYEMGHTWTPSCSKASLDVFTKTFLSGFKFYIPFYLAQNVLRKKYSSEDFLQLINQVWWSTTFVSTHFTLLPAIGCILRQMMGRVYIIPFIIIPFLAGFPSLFIERDARRKTLAIYTFELAADTLLRMLEDRSLISYPRHGDILMFAVAMSIFLYSIRIRVKSHDTAYHVIRYLLCSDGKKKASTTDDCNNNVEPNVTDEPKKTLKSLIDEYIKPLILILKLFPRHESCTHRNSCAHNSLRDVPRLFLSGWLGIGGVLAILKNFASLKNNPLRLFSLLFKSGPLTSGLFLSGYSFVYKAALCGLRWAVGADRPELTIAAATVASPLVRLAPIGSMPFYLTMKCLEFLVDKGRETKLIAEIPYASHWVYGISSCIVCYAVTLEPHNIKSSFFKLIDYYTHPMLRNLNRHTMVLMGANTGWCGGRYPDLDLRMVKPTYLEHIALWLI